MEERLERAHPVGFHHLGDDDGLEERPALGFARVLTDRRSQDLIQAA